MDRHFAPPRKTNLFLSGTRNSDSDDIRGASDELLKHWACRKVFRARFVKRVALCWTCVWTTRVEYRSSPEISPQQPKVRLRCLLTQLPYWSGKIYRPVRRSGRKPTVMKRRNFLGAFAAGTFCSGIEWAYAQQPSGVQRVGIIEDGPLWDYFRERLRELGSVDGQNITMSPGRQWESRPALCGSAGAGAPASGCDRSGRLVRC